MSSVKRRKGKSRIAFPEDYCVVDIETTGLSPEECEIIEIAAVRYRNGEKSAVFSTFVKPCNAISAFITQLTGITNEMVAEAPDISEAIKAFYEFAGDDMLMGYNVNFDINFLYDNLLRCHGIYLENDFVDVLRFARKVLPLMPDRKQTSVAAHYGINITGAHRAEKDCEICNACYIHLRDEMRRQEKEDLHEET
ncbi:PolC-type DNA polymerase III [Ruminococcus flavefaciens]|jgi:DNA polymerase III epsilon subunit family exonuclease|uniref:3'-5' exonuclease n=1 Tax=Ruminococcus flavefaciens TaxID=1265 RepID=UPI0006843870|nr:3'-5' exonuclease [Ruminococcus flavefaciens]